MPKFADFNEIELQTPRHREKKLATEIVAARERKIRGRGPTGKPFTPELAQEILKRKGRKRIKKYYFTPEVAKRLIAKQEKEEQKRRAKA